MEVARWTSGSHSPLEAAASVVTGLRRSRLAPSSRITYRTGQRAWHEFCTKAGCPTLLAETMPLEQQAMVLELFVGYLLSSHNISSASTIQTHLSAVSAWHVDHGVPSPTRLARGAGLLRDTFQGIQRIASAARRAPALTVLDLRLAVEQACRSQREASVACAALSVLAATAMLRVHEYIVYQSGQLTAEPLRQLVLSDSADAVADARDNELMWRARQALRSEDIKFVQSPGEAETMVVKLRAWKFSLTGTEHTNPIKCVGRWSVCAHCCVKNFLEMRARNRSVRGRPESATPWLAQLSDGSFVSEKEITTFIRNGARLSGHTDWSALTPHSLRRGGATQLYHAGLDVTAVREVGRWRSHAGVEPYLMTHTRAYQEMWQKAISDHNTQGATLGTATTR